ncbi:MAG: DUF3458 domain-containing protein, partial [Gammaproteobacteria bacterium]|nr:DUF3458 domain-containing protein [Gammaproteobacteria bacterium]
PLHIPLRMGLLTAAGRELPIKLTTDAAEGEVTRVLNVTEAEQTFEFVNVPEHPTPSLFRGFSAPVKLGYAYTDEQLQLLLKHDSDAFVRWEAGQLFALRRLQTLITDIQAQHTLQFDGAMVQMFRHILNDRQSDKAFLALLLTLPSETYLADQMAKIDPLAIHKAREFLRFSIASELRTELLACYRENQAKHFVFSDEAVGQRALKNVCLSYLMLLNDPAVEKLAADQYYYIDNMTDRISALQDFSSSQSAQRKSILAHFAQQFDNDALVMDKWFTVQALSKRADTFEQVQALMKNPRFELKNPNKVRALIVAFAKMNPGQFHANDGKPYKFLADIVLELDKINPQIASRLVEPLTHWKRYAEPHQAQMHAELTRINKEKLSPDTYEVVSKALV